MPSSAPSLKNRLRRLGILEEELRENFTRSSGPGGQHVNKVSTAVSIRHLPSGLSAVASDSRSQSINRRMARERLCEKLEASLKGDRQAIKAAAATARRRAGRRSPSTKRKMVENKRKRSEIKRLRSSLRD